MKRFLLLIIITLSIACSTNQNIITMMSVDNSQSADFNTKYIKLFRGYEIDTTKFVNMFENNCFIEGDYLDLLNESDHNTDYVFMIERKYNPHVEGSLYLSLFGQVSDSILCKLYLIEIGQMRGFWELDEGNIEIQKGDGYNYLLVEATLKSIGFAISDIIRFPYNENGNYDNVQRFLKIRSKSVLKEKLVE